MARSGRQKTRVSGIFSDRLSDLIDAKKKNSGMTHAEISAEIGVSSASLSEWASDKKTANIDGLYKIADYFNVSADYLLGLTDIPFVNADLRELCTQLNLSYQAANNIACISVCGATEGEYINSDIEELYCDSINKFFSTQTVVPIFRTLTELQSWLDFADKSFLHWDETGVFNREFLSAHPDQWEEIYLTLSDLRRDIRVNVLDTSDALREHLNATYFVKKYVDKITEALIALQNIAGSFNRESED